MNLRRSRKRPRTVKVARWIFTYLPEDGARILELHVTRAKTLYHLALKDPRGKGFMRLEVLLLRVAGAQVRLRPDADAVIRRALESILLDRA